MDTNTKRIKDEGPMIRTQPNLTKKYQTLK